MTEKLIAVLLKRRQSGNTKLKYRAVFSLPLFYSVKVNLLETVKYVKQLAT